MEKGRKISYPFNTVLVSSVHKRSGRVFRDMWNGPFCERASGLYLLLAIFHGPP